MQRRPHLIVTVHGIRTFGHQQERLEALVKAAPNATAIDFYNYKYGYFSVLGFLIPPLRWLVVRQFRNELRDLTARTSYDRIDLVGHSFGMDQLPGFVISHTPRWRKWFARAPRVPHHWFPREDLDAKSFAFGIQFGGRPDDSAPRKIAADAWFDRRQGAGRFMVREQTVRVARDETVSLVLLEDKEMFDDR
jgi:hypothetical protein